MKSLSIRFLVQSRPQLCVGNYFLGHKRTIFQVGTIQALSLNSLPSACFSKSWKRFWKLSLPPKVLDFVWRLCNNCLPLNVRLHQKGVVLDTCRGLCDMEVEDASHLFFNCLFARSCWATARLDFSAAIGNFFFLY